MKKNSRRDGGSMMIKYYTEIKNDGMDKKIWFRIWIWIGSKLGWCRRYNVMRDYSLFDAYNSLEKAYNDMGGDDKWGKDLTMMN